MSDFDANKMHQIRFRQHWVGESPKLHSNSLHVCSPEPKSCSWDFAGVGLLLFACSSTYARQLQQCHYTTIDGGTRMKWHQNTIQLNCIVTPSDTADWLTDWTQLRQSAHQLTVWPATRTFMSSHPWEPTGLHCMIVEVYTRIHSQTLITAHALN